MHLVKNFKVLTGLPKTLNLVWDQPTNFNTSSNEIIITRTTTHFPVELYNSVYPTKATDSRPIEIYRGKTIVGINTGTISVVGNTLSDSGAALPTSPSLAGRILRDSNSTLHRILSNTATSVTLATTPVSGKYVILSDFPQEITIDQQYIYDTRTIAAAGQVSNLVQIVNGQLAPVVFEEDAYANYIYKDYADNKFIVKYNDTTTLYFHETSTPVIGSDISHNTTLLASSSEGNVFYYEDTFLEETEASARVGTGLLEDQFYYYTAFVKEENVNVAQAEYSLIDSSGTTQAADLSTKDGQFGELIHNYWPTVYRRLDVTGDLEDLMMVFGHQFNYLHSIIKTYRLQDTQNVFVTALVPLSQQTGLTFVGYSIGIDTLRRVAAEMIKAYKLKGSKEGIALFIKIITTWDITDGSADFSDSISDFLPNTEALRFFKDTLGTTNSRITETDPFASGGRFIRSLPGIVIPGFFSFREFVINIPNVALHVGNIEIYSVYSNNTIITDLEANFGSQDSLVGNYLLANQEENNSLYRIIGNTTTTLTVSGIISNREYGNNYAVLSPLNTNRFIILNKLMPQMIPFGTKQGYIFT